MGETAAAPGPRRIPWAGVVVLALLQACIVAIGWLMQIHCVGAASLEARHAGEDYVQRLCLTNHLEELIPASAVVWIAGGVLYYLRRKKQSRDTVTTPAPPSSERA